MTNSRTKGSRNERSVAKILEDWSGYEFARTPQSGGLHWKKAHTSGDIVCIDDKHGYKFPFSVECKFHEELDLLHLIQGLKGKKSNKILDFWKQSEGDAKEVKKIPLVFMRRNMMKANMHFVMMGMDLILTWVPDPKSFGLGVIMFKVMGYELAVINSEDLVKTDYNLFYKAGRKLRRNGTK